jgi:hypothetical protein
VLFVRDIFAATEHYRDAMGFSFGKFWGEPRSFAILRRDNMTRLNRLRDVLLSVVGIIVVDLPTWFHYEQEKNNASRGYHRERNKKKFHDVFSPSGLKRVARSRLRLAGSGLT